MGGVGVLHGRYCFNPLDRGNLYQIPASDDDEFILTEECFNPLDRGNLYQISNEVYEIFGSFSSFQSPRSGKFVSDSKNSFLTEPLKRRFNPLDRGNLYQILIFQKISLPKESIEVSIP